MTQDGFFVVSDPAEQARILSALLGGRRAMPADCQADPAEPKLRALGWSDADLCALSTAQQYTIKFQEVQRLVGHLGCKDHGHLEAARLSVAMIDLAMSLGRKIDDAFASIGWPTREPAQYAAMQSNLDECRANVKRLEDQAALRAELDAMPSVDAGGAP